MTIFAQSEKKPNIIFLLTDDQAYRTLGITGNDQVVTPNLDKLGSQGLVFDRHYNTTAVCKGSRASIMTGMYEYKTGCNFMHGSMGAEQWSTSYPVLLKNAGYKVANIGKFGFGVSKVKNVDHKGNEGEGVQNAFDLYLTKGGQCNYATDKNKDMDVYAEKDPHLTQALATAALEFANAAKNENEPFCLTVGFKSPHKPLIPDTQFDHVYKNTVWKKPINYGREAGLHLAAQSRQDRQYKKYWEEAYSTDEKYQKTHRLYHQLIHGVDVAVGKIREGLKTLGIADNTIIIFSSDNGYLMGAHGLGGKVLPYEEGSRAPLIIYDPRIPKNKKIRRTASLSGNIDIAPTILSYANIGIPEVYDGKSLLSIVKDEKKKVRNVLPVIQVFGKEATRCFSMIDGEYKYIYWYFKSEKENLYPTEELFHLTTDPMEMKNLASNKSYKKVLKKMRKFYDDEVKNWGAHSISYNGYLEYGTLFNRAISWDKKAVLIKEKDAKLTPYKTPSKKK
ncbi:sulfatase-like hydrolase/transferase [Flavicella sediminum]|uniref:sulfatase-like hydrolase/transferase n=1 Tax=Flavicella sediminum TaxID=2585141 RepID=UPI001FB5BA50|nr:sulfatase-like hydrolase/transferase [Flavicella sediminum]